MAASTTPMHSAGTKLSWKPKGGTGTKTTIGKLTELGEINQTAAEVDTTTLESVGAYREYIPGYKDPGNMSVSGYYAPGDETQGSFQTLFDSQEIVEWEIMFVDGSSLTFDGYVSGLNYGPVSVDGVPGFGGTIRITGPIVPNIAAS